MCVCMYILASYIHTYVRPLSEETVWQSFVQYGSRSVSQSIIRVSPVLCVHPSIHPCTSSHSLLPIYTYTPPSSPIHTPHPLYTSPSHPLPIHPPFIPHTPLFLLPNLTTSPSPALLFHSSVSRFTPSLYDLASSLPSTSSPGQCPDRRRCRFRFSHRQSGLKVQPGWGQR